MCLIEDYTSYFAFPVQAEHLIKQTGYSGVASFYRDSTHCRPWATEISLMEKTNEIFPLDNIDENEEEKVFTNCWSDCIEKIELYSSEALWSRVDREGRCVVSKHCIESQMTESENSSFKWLYVFNVYCPRNDTTRPEREIYQLKFYHLLEKRIFDLLRDKNNHVIVVGDLNTTHKSIDVYDENEFQYNQSRSRQWLAKLLLNRPGRKMIDAFRLLHPTEDRQFSCWNSFIGARITNFGSRIDYILIDDFLTAHLTECFYLTDFEGSDHCPVVARFANTLQLLSPDEEKFSRNCSKFKMESKFNSQSTSSISRYLVKYNATTSLKDNLEEKQSKDEKLNEKRSRDNLFNSKKLNQTKISSFLTGYKKIRSIPIETLALKSQSTQSHQSNCLEKSKENPNITAEWGKLFDRTEKLIVPICSGHKIPCIRRTVQKSGPNQGREFFSCSKTSIKPLGHPETRCDFFQWIPPKDSIKKKS
ncbi:Endonuclease/Exonuclease/phosphatase-like protein [Sarcoptes scabiei]|uniref:DNA-(apurinic or apyrimidinic site) endonuclease n=1 Tax=Sarcoptes scabiei TaxID=52283 RepID=A0A132A587_SARSC|nr:Endonuclease/Exonuclease/phosphatase-like protein [Sarcoptes scabiei]